MSTVFKEIYSPRRRLKSGRPPRLGKSFMSWFKVVWDIKEPFIMTTVGLDAVMLLRFLKISTIMFSLLSFLGVLVLVPINYFAYRPVYDSKNPYNEIAALRELTIENVPDNSPWLRVHLLFTWIFTFIALNAVWQRSKCLFHLERVYTEVKEGRDGNRRLGSAVPGLATLNDTLARSFSFDAQHHDETNTSSTTPLQRRRFSVSESSDVSLFEIMTYLNAVDPRLRPRHRVGFLGLFGESVDSAEYYAKQYKEWDSKVHLLRRFPENSPPTSVALVTFDSPKTALIASQIVLHRRPFACMAKMAPEPRDIYWPNLSSRSADVSNLERYPIWKQLFDQLGEGVQKFVEQVIPISLFAGWTSCLPAILILLSQMQGLEAQSWIEMSVFSKYFFFLTFNVLLFVVGQTIWASLKIENVSVEQVLKVIGNSMPKSSSSMIGYVMIQALAILPGQLLLIGPILLTWIFRLSPWSRTSPRDRSDAYYPSLLTSINYGIAYTVPVVVWVVGLTYAAIAPLILPFCALFFAVAYFIFKYQLLYVHVPKYETGGMLTPIVARRMLIGIIIFQFTMMAVLAIKYGASGVPNPGNGGGGRGGGNSKIDVDLNSTFSRGEFSGWSAYVQMIVGVIPLPFITMALSLWFSQGYDRLVTNTPMEVVGKVVKELKKNGVDGDRVESRGRNLMNGEKGGRELDSVGDGSDAGSSTGGRWKKKSGWAKRFKKRLGFGREEVESESGGASGGSAVARESTVSSLGFGHGEEMVSHHLQRQDSTSGAGAAAITAEDGHAGHGQGSMQHQQSGFSVRWSDSFFGADGASVFNESILDGSISEDEHDSHREDIERWLFHDGAATSTHEETALLSGSGQHRRDDDEISEGEDIHFPSTKTLEPPSTNVPGILDAPYGSAILPEGDEDEYMETATSTGNDDPFKTPDLQVYTYIHPALIGRLPVAWLPSGSSPSGRLREAREEQVRNQRTLFRRFVGMQRAGVVEGHGGDGAVGLEDENDVGAAGAGKGGAFGAVTGALNSVRSFFDGMASWAHLQMS
ncbi:hypothetical protein HDU76_009775 [Blyttiomyces sp. JEL0837]|nr:hypothetical protein HDU76_009775 [Blyttiomyces sp. JEL0837]